MSFPGETTVFDNANRADGAADAGAGSTIWRSTDLGGTASKLVITGNQFASTEIDKGALTVDEDADLIRIFEYVEGSGYFAYFWRMVDFDGAWQGYWLLISGGTWTITKRISGENTVIATATPGGLTPGTQVGIRVYGDLHEAYIYNGAWVQTPVLSVEDTSFPDAGPGCFVLGGTTLRFDNILSADPSLAPPTEAVTIYVDADHPDASDTYQRTAASDPDTPLKTIQRAAQIAYASPDFGDTILVKPAENANASDTIDTRLYSGLRSLLDTLIPIPFGDNSGNEPITLKGETGGDPVRVLQVQGRLIKNWVFEDIQIGYDAEDIPTHGQSTLGVLERPEDVTFRRVHFTCGGYNVQYWSGTLLWEDCQIEAPATNFANIDGRGFGLSYLPIDGLPGEHSGVAHFDGCYFSEIRGNDAIQIGLGGVTEEWADGKLLVENCTFYDVAAGWEGPHTDSIQILGGYHFEIRNCAFIAVTNALQSSDFRNRLVIFENNLVVCSGGAIQAQGCDEMIIRHNTFYSFTPTDASIVLGTRFIGNLNKVTIVNNVAGGMFYFDQAAQEHAEGSEISHNIFQSQPGKVTPFGTQLPGIAEFGTSDRLSDLPVTRLVNDPQPDWSTPYLIPANYELANSPTISPGIGQGKVTDITLDRLGRAYSNPPDVGCHQSDPGTTVTAVARAPYIVSRSPASGALGVSAAVSVEVVMYPKPGEELEPATVSTGTVGIRDSRQEDIPAVVTLSDLDGDGRQTVTVDLKSSLSPVAEGSLYPLETYTVGMSSDIEDTEGSAFQGTSWTFKVAGPDGPAITEPTGTAPVAFTSAAATSRTTNGTVLTFNSRVLFLNSVEMKQLQHFFDRLTMDTCGDESGNTGASLTIGPLE